MNIVVIQKHNSDSWQGGGGYFVAAAENEEAAKRWIQDEVDGKHPGSLTTYMQGKDADWWIEYGQFSLRSVPVQS